MPDLQRFIDAYKRCESLQAISLLTDSTYALLCSEGLTRPEAMVAMKDIQHSFRSEEPTPFLVFADLRIDKMINSMFAPRHQREIFSGNFSMGDA